MIKVLFICHGNICRSPISEFVLKDMVEKRGIQDQFEIASAATSTEEIWGGRGNPIYPPAQAVLREHGIGKTAYTNFSNKRARQVTRADYERFDRIICMDASNLRWIRRIIPDDPQGKIHLMMSYTGSGRDVADPWYTGDFERTFQDLLEGCEAMLG